MRFGRTKNAPKAKLERIKESSATRGTAPAARLQSAQSWMAPRYRQLVRALCVLMGLAIFAAAEWYVAVAIDSEMYYAMIALGALVAAMVVVAVSPTWGFITWLFLSPFANYFLRPRTKWVIGVDAVLLGLLVISIAFRALADRRRLSKLLFAEWMMIASWIYAMVLRNTGAFGTNEYPTQLLQTSIVVYFIAKSVIRDKKHVAWVALAVLGVGTVWAGFGIYEHFAGQSWLSLAAGAAVRMRGQHDVGAGRSIGPAGHYYLYGNVIILSLLIATHFAGWVRNVGLRIFYYALWPVLLLGLYFGYSRAPYLALVLALSIMLLLARAGFKRYLTVTILIAVAVVLVAPYWLSDRELTRRLESSPKARWATYATSVNMFRAYPFFGVGLNKYGDLTSSYVSGMGHPYLRTSPTGLVYYWARPHCEYLLVLCEQGIVGFILYFGTLLAFIHAMWRARSGLDQRGLLGKDLPSIVIAFTLGVMLTMVTDEFQLHVYMYFIMFTMFAMVERLRELSLPKIESSTPETTVGPRRALRGRVGSD